MTAERSETASRRLPRRDERSEANDGRRKTEDSAARRGERSDANDAVGGEFDRLGGHGKIRGMLAAVLEKQIISEQEYLDGEEFSEVPHEYLNGVVYAMAGGTREHAAICLNITAALHGQLRGKPCRPYSDAMRLRIERGDDLRYYYPDAMVVCEKSASAIWEDSPVVIFEVLSEGTERVDREEKRDAYFGIPSLRSYVLVDSRRLEVTLFRREEGGSWTAQNLGKTEARLALPDIGCELALADIYEGVL